MDLLSTGINAVIVTLVGLFVAWYLKGRFDAVNRRIDRMESRLDARFDRLETRLDAHIDRTASG